MCTGLILVNTALSFWVQFNLGDMYFIHLVKLLVVELQKNGLQIPAKMSLGK